MELQDLRDEARTKEAEALDSYWKYSSTLDQHALAKGYACEMEARDIRARISKIESTPVPPVQPEPKPVKCHYPPDWDKRKTHGKKSP